uniref:Dirigent protein n=1 Tax=Musa acuminata subsp. malaccensis TaxID=214687 RepID=A0A804KI88_MUSAM|nr:PREDICTED: dirigent protein 21-like [Musa acuminata subsp. malaccensis]
MAMAFSSLSALLLLLFPLVLFASFGAADEEKMTHLHFYLHEINSGANATGMTVAVPPGKEFYYETFGAISVIDDILREGPERDSKLIGRAQGLLAQASLEKPALLSAVNFVFTAGKYNGSTFSILGRAVLTELFERAIVGGAGMFRMARGYTLGKVISAEEGYLIMELDAYVVHH